MYHIKQDKRSESSARLLCQGLSDMLKIRKYDEISISDICTSCGTARTTFYRLFDTLDDVLLYQFDTLFVRSISLYQSQSDKEINSYAYIILRIAMSDPNLITALVSSGRDDLFDFATRMKEDTLIQNLHIHIDEKNRQYCTPLLNSMILSILHTWVKKGCEETPDELYEILKDNIILIQKHI